MIPKDYYKILDVKPTAEASAIKRNYRKLAMRYHPDKNQGDALAAEVFSDIAEAYGVLSDPEQRRAYNEKRFSIFDTGRYYAPVITQTSITANINKLQQTIESLDPYRLNRDALYVSICRIVSDDVIDFLKQAQDKTFKRLFIERILQNSKLLTLQYIDKLNPALFDIAGDDEAARKSIEAFIQTARRNNAWNRYKVGVVIIIALVLCLLVFLLGR